MRTSVCSSWSFEYESRVIVMVVTLILHRTTRRSSLVTIENFDMIIMLFPVALDGYDVVCDIRI